jgi:hypothetical protein
MNGSFTIREVSIAVVSAIIALSISYFIGGLIYDHISSDWGISGGIVTLCIMLTLISKARFLPYFEEIFAASLLIWNIAISWLIGGVIVKYTSWGYIVGIIIFFVILAVTWGNMNILSNAD